MTGLNIIKSALRLIQEMTPGQTPHADDTDTALMILNSMLESWSAERLIPFTFARLTQALTVGTQNYTIGPGATINVDRPVRIERAGLVINTIEYPLEIMKLDRWAAVFYKTLQSQPRAIYNNGGSPISTISVWPVPAAAASLILYVPSQIVGFPSLTADVWFPNAYTDAIRYNLAVRLAPEWGRVLRADVMELARDSKAEIMRLNLEAPTMKCDSAVLHPGGTSFDIQSGEFL
jgi:hypothetical protein